MASPRLSPIVELLLSFESGGTLLDMGVGRGHNALYLAKLGFNVTALDIDPVAIEQLASQAADHHLPIQCYVADVREFEFPECYQIIMCSMLLHLCCFISSRQGKFLS